MNARGDAQGTADGSGTEIERATDAQTEAETIAHDVETLRRLGYRQELARRMGGFSNFAISLSIICILAGGVTSFHLGLSGVGGAAIGLGWPLVCLFSLAVAATLGQLASAFPTAGGLYHWASILGGRGWGWATAWFNLAGLVTVLAAINVGTYTFVVNAFGPALGFDPAAADPRTAALVQLAAVGLITGTQAIVNHLGIRATTRLTDFSGYWILGVSVALTAALLACATSLDPSRLVTFGNFSGLPEAAPVWPRTESLAWLFALGFLLPAYTITGFDASAHASEETVGASEAVPRGIVRSVLVSGLFGWVLLSAVVLAVPSVAETAARGDRAFSFALESVLPGGLATAFAAAIGVAQYLCGLATVTSASRMAYAFARDGGLPFGNGPVRSVSARFRTPAVAIWCVAIAAVAFTVWTPFYATITSVCTIFLYLSYTLPTAAGLVAYRRSWTEMGPWTVGRLYRPLAAVCVVGCGLLVLVGMAPPNDRAAWTVGGVALALVVGWYARERRRFPGPPALG